MERKRVKATHIAEKRGPEAPKQTHKNSLAEILESGYIVGVKDAPTKAKKRKR